MELLLFDCEHFCQVVFDARSIVHPVLAYLSDSQSGYIPLIARIRRIDVDEGEHLELLCPSRASVADRHHFVYRGTIGAEKLIPQWPIGIIT